MSEELVSLSPEEALSIIRYARHTALAADQICGSILNFSEQLEKLNIIPKDRKTKKMRDQHLRKHFNECGPSNKKIEEMAEKLKDVPDAESLVSSLFRDLTVRKVKRVLSKQADQDEKENSQDENEE